VKIRRNRSRGEHWLTSPPSSTSSSSSSGSRRGEHRENRESENRERASRRRRRTKKVNVNGEITKKKKKEREGRLEEAYIKTEEEKTVLAGQPSITSSSPELPGKLSSPLCKFNSHVTVQR
jgi:hypothetical protein